ncbi:hypothetical protein K501DRAFT_274386 [Backusella circina FSU 941]|nr:hypothetical protein K501DRAFT_274386 [Backusella circina FSU 941]
MWKWVYLEPAIDPLYTTYASVSERMPMLNSQSKFLPLPIAYYDLFWLSLDRNKGQIPYKKLNTLDYPNFGSVVVEKTGRSLLKSSLYIQELVDEEPQVTVTEVVDDLIANFEAFCLSKSQPIQHCLIKPTTLFWDESRYRTSSHMSWDYPCDVILGEFLPFTKCDRYRYILLIINKRWIGTWRHLKMKQFEREVKTIGLCIKDNYKSGNNSPPDCANNQQIQPSSLSSHNVEHFNKVFDHKMKRLEDAFQAKLSLIKKEQLRKDNENRQLKERLD